MRSHQRQLEQHSNADCDGNSGVGVENPHWRSSEFPSFLQFIVGILLTAVVFVFDATPVEAAFLLPDTGKSVSGLTECTGLIADVLSLCIDPSKANRSTESEGAGAGSSTVPMSDSPADPSLPWSRLPSRMAFAVAFAFGATDQGSAGAGGNSTAGGSAGFVGIFASKWKMQGQLLLNWFKTNESLVLPTAPPSDIFRPPPIAANYSVCWSAFTAELISAQCLFK